MSLKHGLLGLLNYGKMTGYELDKAFKESLNFFWQAQTSQIYRELSTMEKSGWLVSEIVIQSDKPNKKLYSITEMGEKELSRWLVENGSIDEVQARSIFLMRLFFSGEKSVEQNISMLKKYREKFEAALSEVAKVGAYTEHYRQLVDNKQSAVYWELAADFGKSYYLTSIEWISRTIKRLEGERV